ncbi:MAG: molybdopterin-dependent oxidoreductase [Eggerthellaceae bacterium]|nr:molybdopterin-dependent oxidoreductase [Eggerthellaceae bacterium]
MSNEKEWSETPWRTGTKDDYWVRSCAWSAPGCHPVGCGVKLHVVGGRLVDVEGDETHPITQGRLCIRCLTLPEYIYNPDRITYPMKRAHEDLGKNTWERISWDEAIDLIVENTERLQEQYGRETVAVFGGTGREACLYGPAISSAVFRTPYYVYCMSGQACYGPRNMTATTVFGRIGYPEIDFAASFPERYDAEEFTLPELIVCWGKDPLPSNPDGLFGHSIVDMMKRGTKVIMIDPRITWLGSRSEMVLQVRPGTDTALAMAVCNVIIEEELYNKELVEQWAFGFEDFRERVATMPPEKAAEICGLQTEEIYAFAHRYATAKPASIAWGLTFDQQYTGTQAGVCVMAMIFMTGNLDVPGGNTCGGSTYSFLGKWRIDTQSCLPPGQFANRIGKEEYPLFTSQMFFAQPDAWLEHLESDEPTKFRMAYISSSNPFACNGNEPDRWYRAFKKRIEFCVVTDLFMTPTAMALADVFLPVSTFVEHNGLVQPYYGGNMQYMGAINKAITVGECKSDLEISILLGRRLNPEAWPWESAEEFFEEHCSTMLDMHFSEIQDKVCYQLPYSYEKYKKGEMRPDGEPGFNSITGMAEFSSTFLGAYGEDPLPYFTECPYAPVETASKYDERYPLTLTSGMRRYTSFHSEHRSIKSLREIDPWPWVELNPKDAEKYGILEGSWVTIENMFGKCTMQAQIKAGVKEGVVVASHGWWFPEQEGDEPNLYGAWKANINKLMPNRLCSPLGYGSIHDNMCCTIYPCDGLGDGIVAPALDDVANN